MIDNVTGDPTSSTVEARDLEVFLRDAALTGVLVEGTRARASLSGIDPSEYTEVTSALSTAADWPTACVAAADRHLEPARAAAAAGRRRSAAEAFRDASRWFHLATCAPHPDRALHRHAAGQAWRALVDGLTATGERIEQLTVEGPHGSRGLLRRPAPAHGLEQPAPLVVIVPGLDSSAAEFAVLADALAVRGLATLSLDGPGQGVLSGVLPARYDYEQVVTAALDALGSRTDLDLDRIGVVGLSLGGFYVPRVAAFEPRIRAAATVTGPYRLGPWERLWPSVRHILTLRLHGRESAEEFTDHLDLDGIAERVDQPLLVVAGGQDQLCTAAEARRLAEEAPAGELLVVEQGDHLCANTPWLWRPRLCDWLGERLVG